VVLAGTAEHRCFDDRSQPSNHSAIKPFSMKWISGTMRHFFEGFFSFYTSIFREMKSW